jgi:protease-4
LNSYVKRFLKIIFSLFIALVILSALGRLFNLSEDPTAYKAGNLAVIEVTGVIAESLPVLEIISDIRDNENYKAVVVRVNSPGGAVGSSQEIYLELKKLSEKLPVVVSMGDVAASGGLYAALGGEYIFTLPGTLTGSMGVLLQMTNLSRLMDKIYVDPVTITSGSLKAAGNPLEPMGTEARRHFKRLIDRTFESFKQTVTERRKLSKEAVKILADGRVIEGTQAVKIGLVDAIGTFEDAVQYASEKGKIKDVKLAWLSRKPKSFWQKAFDEVSSPITDMFARKSAKFQFMWEPGF